VHDGEPQREALVSKHNRKTEKNEKHEKKELETPAWIAIKLKQPLPTVHEERQRLEAFLGSAGDDSPVSLHPLVNPGTTRRAVKVLAQRITPELASAAEGKLAHDSSTNALIHRYRQHKGG